MSQALTVARATVRDLWMTLRLLVVLVAFIGTSAVVGLVPATPSATLQRLAVGLAVATVATAAVSAWTMADERLSGRAGWLVTRSVSRVSYLIGLFVGLAAVTTAGVAASVLIGWTATFNLVVRVEPPAIGAVMLAVATMASAAIALGLAAGALLRPLPAAIVASAAVVAVGAAATLGEWGSVLALPGRALTLLTDLLTSPAVLPDALRLAGGGMVATAVLLVLAGVAIGRAEL